MPTAAVCSIHLADLLGTLYALHRQQEREYGELTDEQLEVLAAQSDVTTFFGGDAWDLTVAEVQKRTGLAAQQLAGFAGAVNLSVPDGFEDVAAAITRLDQDGFTAVLLDKLREHHPGAVEALKIAPHGQASAASEGQIVLHRDDVKILEALARSQTTHFQLDLESSTNLSRGTIGTRLERLREAGLVDRPNGERGGDAITDAGRAELARLRVSVMH
jgi:hypothetical protein